MSYLFTSPARSEIAAMRPGAGRCHAPQAIDTAFSCLPEAASARSGILTWQIGTLLVVATTTALAILLVPAYATPAVTGALAIIFGAHLWVRLLAVRLAVRSKAPRSPKTTITSAHPVDKARPVDSGPGDPLPLYSVLITLYDEAPVVAALVAAMKALDYPSDRLDIWIILEADDAATRAALQALILPAHIHVAIVPDGQPRTKPRALCYGLTMARGDYVVVYDAEDRPEPDQLARAVEAFQTGGPRLGCLQAKLNVYNPHASLITRQFAIEYTALFDGVLPALIEAGAPIPLGGTSNHFPRAVLDEAGGWDPWNVTEDADLGFRLARRGWQVGMLHSTTWEEAPPNALTWFNQRTRWQKGWFQTYGVHMRDPVCLWRDLGTARFLWFQMILGGGLLAALAHPWFLAVLVAQIILDNGLGPPMSGVAWGLWWFSALSLAASALTTILLGLLTVRNRKIKALVLSALLSPLMWVPVSLAAHRAIWELLRRPFHWAKTPHGTDMPQGIARRAASHRRDYNAPGRPARPK